MNRLGHPRVGLVEAPEAVDTTRHEPRSTAQQRGGTGERPLVAQTRPVLRSMPHNVHVGIIAQRHERAVSVYLGAWNREDRKSSSKDLLISSPPVDLICYRAAAEVAQLPSMRFTPATSNL